MSEALNKQIDGTHYKEMGIQPWEIIDKNKLDYWEGAALKYLLRWRKKDGIIDLKKIVHYIEYIIERAERGEYGQEFVKQVKTGKHFWGYAIMGVSFCQKCGQASCLDFPYHTFKITNKREKDDLENCDY